MCDAMKGARVIIDNENFERGVHWITRQTECQVPPMPPKWVRASPAGKLYDRLTRRPTDRYADKAYCSQFLIRALTGFPQIFTFRCFQLFSQLLESRSIHEFSHLGKHFSLFFFHSMMLDIFHQDFQLGLELLAI
jgi:hypothetical protein